MDELFTEAQAAKYLTIEPTTLRNWRYYRQKIPFVKIGASVRYRRQDLDTYLGSRVVMPIDCEIEYEQ